MNFQANILYNILDIMFYWLRLLSPKNLDIKSLYLYIHLYTTMNQGGLIVIGTSSQLFTYILDAVFDSCVKCFQYIGDFPIANRTTFRFGPNFHGATVTATDMGHGAMHKSTIFRSCCTRNA